MGGVTPIAPESTPSAFRGARGQALALGLAFALTLPGVLSRLSDAALGDVVAPLFFGLAILGSAFLLAWAAEVLQLDVSQGLALTVLALIAVLPEYAVDFTFAYKAGENPEKYAPLALANMTGGNRLLIGVGWSLVVLLAAWRMKSIAKKRGYEGELDTDTSLERPHAIEIMFLAIATLYSFTLPLKRTLTIVDSIILISIFVLFVVRIWKAPSTEPHLVGPARLIGRLPVTTRRVVVGGLLAYAAGVIFLCAAPFAESLVHLGEQAGISTFLLVQWVAPLASEAPELLVAALFAWRLNTERGARHAALVEGQPMDAARGVAPDRVRDLRGPSERFAPRLTPAGGTVPHRGTVGVRDRDPRQPEDERARGVDALRAVHLSVRAWCGAAREPARARADRSGSRVPRAGRGHPGAPTQLPSTVGA